MAVTTNTRKLAALLGASGAGIHTDGTLQTAAIKDGAVTAVKVAADMATQSELDAVSTTVTANSADTTSVRQDISILALREAITEDRVANNLPNSFIDQFQSDAGIGTETNTDRNASEYVGTTGGTTQGALANGLVAHWGSAGAISKAVDGSGLLTLTHGSSPDSDDGIFSYGNSADGNPSTPYKFSANQAFSIEMIPKNPGTHGPYFAITDAAHSGEMTSGSTPLQTDTWQFLCYPQGSNYYKEVSGGSFSVVKTFTDTGIQTGATTYRFDRSAAGVLKAYQGGVLHHTFTDTFTGEMQMWFTGQGGTGSSAMEELKYAGSVASLSATGTMIGNANVPSAAQTKVSGVMLYKDAYGTATPGTQLKIYFTCNGGTNWTEAASYTTATPVFSTGIKMVKLGETICTSGSDVRYKAVWASQVVSSLETQLHGIGLNY